MALDILSNINIDENYIDEILSVAGYPVVSLEDFEIDNKNDIIKLAIRPALRKYYSFFPIPFYQELAVNMTQWSIDFPTNETFDVVDVRVNTLGSLFATPTGNPMVDARYWGVSTRAGYNNTRYDYGMNNAYIKERSSTQAIVDTTKAVKFTLDMVNRKLNGYCNTFGKLNITWAQYSNDFDAIPMVRKDEVLDLCKGYFLEKLVMIRGQLTGGLPVSNNFQLLQEKSKDLIDSTIKKWENFTKVIILKN